MKALMVSLCSLILLMGAKMPSTSTQPATSPSVKQNVLASLAIDDVELEYKGPLEVQAGQPIMVRLALRNRSQVPIHYGGTGNVSLFKISIKGPDDKRVGGTYAGLGDGVGGLNPGQSIEELINLRELASMNHSGLYRVEVSRGFNDVLHFTHRVQKPRLLELKGIPIHVLGEKNGTGPIN